MNSEVFDLFPLTVLRDKISLSLADKKNLVHNIFAMEKETENKQKRQGDAWLGDTSGHEYLLKNSKMHKLAQLIGEKIKNYTEMLSIDNEKIYFFYQRSWATITRSKERIHPHSHDQSNISFAYYPLKPDNSGDIRFIVQPQNEIATGLFHQEKIKLGVLKNVTTRNTPNVDIHIKEDDIIVFPSKIKHATVPNKSDQPRISISGDITIMLKDTYGHERLMPHYDNWQMF